MASLHHLHQLFVGVDRHGVAVAPGYSNGIVSHDGNFRGVNILGDVFSFYDLFSSDLIHGVGAAAGQANFDWREFMFFAFREG